MYSALYAWNGDRSGKQTMTRRAGWVAMALIVAGSSLPATVFAHGKALPPPPPASEPRFTATSHVIEITGILKDGVLWCYADHYASDAPWPGLKLDVQIGAQDRRTREVGGGVYRLDHVNLTDVPQAVIVTVSGSQISDLVSGVLPAAKQHH